MSTRNVHSSFIESFGYVPLLSAYRESMPDCPPSGFIIVKFKSGSTYAYLAPYWLYGLILTWRSPGKAYNSLVKGRLPAVNLAKGGVKW